MDGGSGYVWTSGTAANAPSGYNVDTKYYLANAGTYGSGETGFTSNPNTDGNGYVRITLISATQKTEEEITATRWIDIEEQKENGTLTGEFYYNEHTITVIDTKNTKTKYPTKNEKPVIEEVKVSSIKRTTATITVTGTDPDGDNLTYTLEINNETYVSKTGIFNIVGLEAQTTYAYTVTVKDPYSNTSTEGTLTTKDANKVPVIVSNADYKSGKTTKSFTIEMMATDSDEDNLTYTLYYSTSKNGKYRKAGTASEVAGTKTTISKESLSEYTEYWWYITVTDGEDTVTSEKQSLKTYCSGTGENICYETTYCVEGSETEVCSACGGDVTAAQECATCQGRGFVVTYRGICPTHGYAVEHWYCTVNGHNWKGAVSYHSCCEHGYTTQHD